jgi:hypothetical protein
VALALLVVTGVVLWQGSRDTETAAPVPEAAAPDVPVRVSATTPITLYIVGSQAQADAVRSGIDEATAIGAQSGQLGPTVEVLLVASAAHEVVSQMLAEMDAMRDSLGLLPYHVIDLRPS